MNVISRDAISISVDALRERLTGDFVTPDDPQWDEARLAWNLAVDQRPAAVAIPETVEDIVEVVRYARANGYRVAGQSTGHNAHPLAEGMVARFGRGGRLTGQATPSQRSRNPTRTATDTTRRTRLRATASSGLDSRAR